MRKILLYTLLLSAALMSSSCRRAAEKIRQNIRIEAIEQFQPRGLTGADLTLRVKNNTGYKLALYEARLEVFYGRGSVGTILLREGVEVPRHTTMSATTRWQLRMADPLALFVLTRKLKEGDLAQVTVDFEVKGKGGPRRMNISRERMPLSEFLHIFGLSIDHVTNYLKE